MSNKQFELAEVIESLRENLMEAQRRGEDKNLRFNVTNVEIELQTVVKKDKSANGKAKFWVLEAGAAAKHENTATQKIKLSLQAVDMDKTNPETGQQGGTVQLSDLDD